MSLFRYALLFVVLAGLAWRPGSLHADIKDGTEILVGSELDYPPFAQVTADGQADGFSVDLMKAVCEAMGLKPTFRVGPWEIVRKALEQGEVDALPLVSYSQAREKVFDFTVPHTVSYAVMFKRKGSPAIASEEDARAKSIIAMHSDATHDYLEETHLSDRMVLVKTVNDALRLLASGAHDYAFVPRLVGLLTIDKHGLSNLEETGPLFDVYGRGYGFAVREGNSELQAHLNQGLQIVRQTGRYDEIYEKWFGVVDPKGISQDKVLGYVLWGIGVAMVLIGISFGWSVSLKSKVNQRTRELEAARRDAEAANKAKSEFLAAMSHDLRTPLNAIMGFSEMMEKQTFGPLGDAHYNEYAEDIHSSGAHLVSLINDVLDLSKVEAGKYELIEENLDVVDQINAAVVMIMPLAEAKEITLTVENNPRHICFLGDQRVLTQILNNLLSNAIKFTDHGGEVTVMARVDGESRLIVSVTDTGVGMSQGDITKALRPFEQADSNSARKHTGTGLGLHLSWNFMQLHGGKLEIDSEQNKGTTVRAVFPPHRTLETT